jgi:hypothetical protein
MSDLFLDESSSKKSSPTPSIHSQIFKWQDIGPFREILYGAIRLIEFGHHPG